MKSQTVQNIYKNKLNNAGRKNAGIRFMTLIFVRPGILRGSPAITPAPLTMTPDDIICKSLL